MIESRQQKQLYIRKRYIRFPAVLSALIFCCLIATDRFGEQFALKRQEDKTLQLYIEATPEAAVAGKTVTLTILGRIKAGHHIYSIHQQGYFSPEPTGIIIRSDLLTAKSELEESPPVTVFDYALNMKIKIHKNDFRLKRQYIVSKNISPGSHILNGSILYQICDNRICSFPLEKSFTIHIGIKKQKDL